ncbi:hypothetical protein H2248_010547 [Termitomyces sp. 'cryptogamus']|nr:hypothetical protein H2248_010547 [Termitomyces sp. 'cryptogamus']
MGHSQTCSRNPRSLLQRIQKGFLDHAVSRLLQIWSNKVIFDEMQTRPNFDFRSICRVQAASRIAGEEVVRHRAHVDHFRQKISITRPTYVIVVEENKQLREKNNDLKRQLGVLILVIPVSLGKQVLKPSLMMRFMIWMANLVDRLRKLGWQTILCLVPLIAHWGPNFVLIS